MTNIPNEKSLKKVLSSSLDLIGYEMIDKEAISYRAFLLDKYKETLKELEEMYAVAFQHRLSARENRLDLLTDLMGTNPSEAFYILYHLSQVLTVEGDICEFGVAQGTTSALMANEIRDTNKNIWLFDSFQGLPMPTEKDLLKDDIFNLGSMNAYTGAMACGLDMVTERLMNVAFPFERVRVIPGFIEDTIDIVNLPDKICFAYVDFDLYEPIKIALNFLDKTLGQGGYVIVDDYDWFSTGAKTAVDEFVAEKQGRYMIHVPEKQFGHFCVLRKS